MSSPGRHCESIVKPFMGCLEEHGFLSRSLWFYTEREREAPVPPACVCKSLQVRTLRHAVGVIITLEDYNDTPPRTRSPVSTVIKQTAAFCG